MLSPQDFITKGYDLHVVFSDSQHQAAHALFEACLGFLDQSEISYHKHRFFSKPVGPWPTPMWQIILPHSDQVHSNLGLCIAWFMLNRGEFSVMIHPNTHQEQGRGGEYEDHSQNHLWLGSPLKLKMEIFEKDM